MEIFCAVKKFLVCLQNVLHIHCNYFLGFLLHIDSITFAYLVLYVRKKYKTFRYKLCLTVMAFCLNLKMTSSIFYNTRFYSSGI